MASLLQLCDLNRISLLKTQILWMLLKCKIYNYLTVATMVPVCHSLALLTCGTSYRFLASVPLTIFKKKLNTTSTAIFYLAEACFFSVLSSLKSSHPLSFSVTLCVLATLSPCLGWNDLKKMYIHTIITLLNITISNWLVGYFSVL